MSKSYKHTPSVKWGKSDKDDKVIAHKKFRRSTKDCLRIQPNEVDYYNEDGNIETELEYKECPVDIKEVSDNWNFSSDGGSHYVDAKYAEENNWNKKHYLRK